MAARRLETVIEAVLFASDAALSAERIAAALERKDATPAAVRETVARLNAEYAEAGRAFEIIEVAGGYKLTTLPEFNNYVRSVLRSRSRERLSQAAMETLAIVAYRQPITRAEIEVIRGVEAGPVLRMLVDRGLVRIAGRSETLGHPLLYGTTKLFLETFGLSDLDALPRAEELMAQAAAETDADDEESPESSEAVAEAVAALGDEPADDAPEAADSAELPTGDAEEPPAGESDETSAETGEGEAPAEEELEPDDESVDIIRLENHRGEVLRGDAAEAPPEEDESGDPTDDESPQET